MLENKAEILIQNKRKKMWIRIFIVVACLVALGTAYALIMPAITMSGKTYCGFEEHLHADDCYIASDNLVCASDDNHSHTDVCYEKILSCDKTEHEHSLICYSNPEADIETADDWEKTLPDSSNDNKAERLAAVAKSQLGYSESDKNYIVTENNEINGRNRYGAWYGDAYADWSAIFIAFCLNYSDISKDNVPYSDNCYDWQKDAEKLDLYRVAGDYVPLTGDIVFLDTDFDSEADHMAIVTETSALTDYSSVKLHAIVGDLDGEVQNKSYRLNDKAIMGYIKISDEYSETADVDNEIALLAETGETVPAGLGYYHSTSFPDYAESKYAITLEGHASPSQVSTFILLPKKSQPYQWIPDTMNWNASGGYNYEVTYCVDPYHSASASGGSDYIREDLDSIDDFNADTKAVLTKIVQNAYPFITAEEMRSRLNASGITGNFGESEMMAATQAALWQQTVPAECTGKLSPKGMALNGVLPDVDNISIVEEIKEWLLNTASRDSSTEMISIDNAHQSVKKNDDGTYDVTVEVTLNRPVNNNDNIEAILSAGEDENKTASTKLESGTNSFSITLEGLTSTAVNLKLTGVQNNISKVYFYRGADHNSTHYQHMIGLSKGSENIDIDYPFYGDDTFVSVKKVWAGGESHPDSVTVYLIVDGIKSDKYLILSDENNWQGSWEALPAGHKYEVQEIEIPGYTASISSSQISSSSGSWVKTDKFRNDDLFLIESGGKLLAVDSGGSLVSVSAENILNSTEINAASGCVWSAEFISGAGGYRLTADNKDLALFKYNQVKALSAAETSLGSEAGRAVKYKNSKLYFEPYGDTAAYSCYITGLPNNGTASAALQSNRALDFNIYTWQAKEGNGGTEYTITNTPKEIPKTSISVNKSWQGDSDNERPDEIKITLYANNKEYQTVTIKKTDNWSYVWDNLPAEDENAVPIKYTVKEIVPDGYASSVEEIKTGEFVITNTKVETTSVSVEKRWAGLEEGQSCPESVQVYLLANGERYSENIELSAKNAWRYCWSNIPKTDSEGNTIEYSVAEVPMDGFNADIQLSKPDVLRLLSDDNISWKAVDKLTDGKTYLIVADNGALASKSADSYLLKMLNVEYALANNTMPDSTALWTASASDDGFLLVNSATQTPLSFMWNDWSMKVCFTVRAEDTPVCYTGTNKISAYWSFNNTTYYFTEVRTSKPYADFGDSSLTDGTTFTFYELQNGQGSTPEPPSAGDIHYIITNTAGEFTLAETGGIGTHWFILAGMLITAGGLLYGFSLIIRRGKGIKEKH